MPQHFDDDLLPDEVPEGFLPHTHSGPFSIRNGPFYFRDDNIDGHIRGFRARQRHCNGANIVHGGCLMSFADEVMHYNLGQKTGDLSVTIRLNADFLSSVRPGSWVEARTKIRAAADGAGFGEVLVSVGARPILRATGVFKLLQPRD